MKKLVLLFFLILSTPVWTANAGECETPARVLLSSASSQGKFLVADFFFNLFGELREVVYNNRATITNVEVNDMLNGWSEAGRNPRITDVFEVSHAFGTSVANLLDHAGNLKNHIDLSGIVMDKTPLSKEQRRRIFEKVHFNLVSLIEQNLHNRRLSLDELAEQVGMPPKLFHGIVVGMKLPRAPVLLAILAKLDADPVGFVKSVEASLLEIFNKSVSHKAKETTKTWARGYVRAREIKYFDAINFSLREIFSEIDLPDHNSDVMRFKYMLYQYQYHYTPERLSKIRKRRKLTLAKIFQTARMLGMGPSQVLKYSRDLKSHAVMDGIESRTLLSKAKLKELSKLAHQHLVLMFKESGMGLAMLSLRSEIPVTYLQDVIRGKNLISYQSMERILAVWDLNVIRFFEQLESTKAFDIHSLSVSGVAGPKVEANLAGPRDTTFMGGRILKIMELLTPFSTKFKLEAQLITKNINTRTRQDLTQRDISFKTVYKASRVGNISLSDLVGERPIETLIDPQRAILEKVPRDEIKRAKRLLAHLLLSEAMRQKISHGRSLTGLAIKAHLYGHTVRRILSGAITPFYLTLHQLVERGLEIPLPRFLENFESKFEELENISLASRNALGELEGPYLSEGVENNMKRVKERFEQVRKILLALKVEMQDFEAATGIRAFRPSTRGDGHEQIYTVVKICRFLGISLQDFLGKKDLANLVDADRLDFKRMSDDDILQAINTIKTNIKRRSESLNLSNRDFEIMLGAIGENKLAPLFSVDTGITFPWFRYFQASEILALRLKDEDDLFLLDGVAF